MTVAGPVATAAISGRSSRQKGMSSRPQALRKAGGARAPIRKKATAILDTNLSSYDRTDPFYAFNALLKLLGSLPSRIGGCQYKLTPEEHRLSLHLLTIVEPFVGLSPSRRTITRQPTEVLDSIVFFVESKSDLLSLALSCHRMYDIVFPRHYNYRSIKCKVSSISVWNHLIVHRSLARNVRRLEILDERSSQPEVVPPGILTTDTDLESTDDELGLHDKQERFLVLALTKMTALSSFTWSCNHSPIAIDSVWPTLVKCCSLREMEICDNLVFGPVHSGEEAGRKSPRPIILPSMKSVTMRSTSHAYGSTKHPSLSRISGILHHCPNLKDLDIQYTPSRTAQNGNGVRPSADEFLLYSRWPQLTTLNLTNLRCSPTTGFDSASSFLAAHNNLEILRIDIGIKFHSVSSPLIFAPNTLPHLKELQANKDIVNAILASPCDRPRPLETLKGFHLSGQQGNRDTDGVLLVNLRRNGKTIKRIELNSWNEMEDIKQLIDCVPALTWLDIGKRGWTQPRDKQSTVATNSVEWVTLLSELPDLTTFHGIRFFYEVSQVASSTTVNVSLTDRSRIRKNDETASMLAWKCPKLRRLDHWEEGSGKVIVLVRDGDRSDENNKVRWEIRRVKA